jgi:hypothetical protein
VCGSETNNSVRNVRWNDGEEKERKRKRRGERERKESAHRALEHGKDVMVTSSELGPTYTANFPLGSAMHGDTQTR